MSSSNKSQNYSHRHEAISKPEHSLAEWKHIETDTKSLKERLDFSSAVGWNNAAFDYSQSK